MKRESPSTSERDHQDRPYEQLCDAMQIASTQLKVCYFEEMNERRDLIQEAENPEDLASATEDWMRMIDLAVIEREYADLFSDDFLQSRINAYRTVHNAKEEDKILFELEEKARQTIDRKHTNQSEEKRQFNLFSSQQEVLEMLDELYSDINQSVFSGADLGPGVFAHRTDRQESKLEEKVAIYHIEKEEKLKGSVEIDGSRIGWLNTDEKFSTDIELLEYGGLEYWFGQTYDQHSSTKKAYEKLSLSDKAERLIGALKSSKAAKLIHSLDTGLGEFRPVNKNSTPKGNDKKIDTDYPAYKLDVEGTNNRAIFLVLGKKDDRYILVLTALFDHDDDTMVYRSLNL
jgi:hypothetical protein